MADRVNHELQLVVQELLLLRKETLATAESLTAGDLAAHVTAIPGASQIYLGGVITYATSLKRQLLGVTAPRVISAECAEQMAIGVRRLTGANWGLATTGVAGPQQQENQPVGTVFVAVSSVQGVRSRVLELSAAIGPHQRAEIRQDTCAAAIELLREMLEETQS
jgi:nicotinamide-nucleotide amidase